MVSCCPYPLGFCTRPWPTCHKVSHSCFRDQLPAGTDSNLSSSFWMPSTHTLSFLSSSQQLTTSFPAFFIRKPLFQIYFATLHRVWPVGSNGGSEAMAGLQSILLPNWLGYFSDCLHPYSRAPYWTRSISLGFKGDGSEIFFPLYQIRKLDLRKQSFSKAPQHWVFHCKHSGPNPVCVPLHQGHPGAHKIISQVPRRNFSWQFFPYFNVH